MLGIILMGLKIIGIILLTLLGVFIFLIVLLFFLPVFYRIQISEGPDEDPPFQCRIKIFAFQVYPKKKRCRRIKKKFQPVVTEEEERQTVSQQAANQKPDTDKISHKQSNKKHKENKTKVKSSAKLRESWKSLQKELSDPGNKRALKHVIREVCYLLRHYGPRRVWADATFSLGDPANTGYATAALSLCPFSYWKRCRITPDFVTEKLYLRGWVDMRGHMRAIHTLCSVIRLLADKDIRNVIRKVRK